MSKLLKAGEGYAGRAEGAHPVSITLDQDAWLVLRRFVPTPKGHGHFVSRLLHEFAARRDVTDRVTSALGAGGE